MKYSKAIKVRSAYIATLFLIYMQILILCKERVEFTKILIFLVLMVMSYIFDTLEFRVQKYRGKDLMNSIFVYGVGFPLVYLVLDEIKSIYIFITLFFVQNIYRVIIIKFLTKKKNVVVIGTENKNLIEIIGRTNGYKYLKTITEWEISKKSDIDVIVLEKDIESKEIMDKIIGLKMSGVTVKSQITFLEELEGRIDIEKLSREWILNGYGFDILRSNFQKRVKRVFDIVVALLIAIPALPMIIVTYIFVKCDIGLKNIFINPKKIIDNPAFFKQKRIGLGGKEFEIVKFRSMKLHDPTKHSKYASKDDNRITKFGKFIRKTRLDELPQLINVFRGEMSFVGPRPEWNELGREYEEKIKFYFLRYGVKPGLTGWAQVMYPYGANLDDTKRKLEYDLYYIKHQNFILDMMIFFKTVKTVLFGKGV